MKRRSESLWCRCAGGRRARKFRLSDHGMRSPLKIRPERIGPSRRRQCAVQACRPISSSLSVRHPEPGLLHSTNEHLEGPGVGRRDGVIELREVIRGEEPQEKTSFWANGTRELGERPADLTRQGVNEGIPRQHATERTLLNPEMLSFPDTIVRFWVVAPGAFDEFRNRIHTFNVGAGFPQTIRPLPRPRTNVNNPPIDTARPLSNTRHIQYRCVLDAPHGVDVFIGSSCVGRNGSGRHWWHVGIVSERVLAGRRADPSTGGGCSRGLVRAASWRRCAGTAGRSATRDPRR